MIKKNKTILVVFTSIILSTIALYNFKKYNDIVYTWDPYYTLNFLTM